MMMQSYGRNTERRSLVTFGDTAMMSMMLGDIATFARPKGAKDKRPRAKRTPYGPPGMTGMKASTRAKNTVGTGAIIGGVAGMAHRYGDGATLGKAGKFGLKWGLGSAAALGAIQTAAHLRGPRSPVKRWRKKSQAKAYEIADRNARRKARRSS